jgi:hypothetical protein
VKNLYVSCPFCNRVFDAYQEPSMAILIDNKPRTAHLACLPAASRTVYVPEPRPEKANGNGHAENI